MVKLLIVDDEVKTRQTLYRYVPWFDLGIVDVEQAEDGLQALQKSVAFVPDIVLTDVRMPRMNGIELAKELRAVLPRCKIIFLSAYSDLEYLKTAIKLQAFDYIEKPVDLEEIGRVIKSVVAEYRKDLQQWNVERKLREHERMLRARQLAVSLCGIGEKPEPERIVDELLHPDIRFPTTGTFVCLSIRFEAAEDGIEELSVPSPPELQQLDRRLSDLGFGCLMGAIKQESWVMLAAMPSSSSMPELRQTVEDYARECGNNGANVCIAIGGPVGDLFSLPDSYKQASSLSKRSFYFGYAHVLTFDNEPSRVYSFDPHLQEQWLRHLRNNQLDEAIRLIRQLVSELRQHPDTPVEQVKNLFYSLWIQLYQGPRKLAGLSVHENGNRLPEADALASLSTLEQYEEFLLRETESVANENSGKTGGVVSRIAHIIREQAGNQNLTINSIASQLFLTSSYVCLLFKNETGLTVNQYLTSVRMEMAKQLIARHKIHEVAKRVGYTDTKYFTRLFKKEVGWTPSEYRERLRP